ncbi:MAG: radical SAM protein [Pseudomonadota bacterium]
MTETDSLLDLILGFACNVECDYCTMTREMRSRNLTTAEVVDALQRGAGDGLRAVSFGGGEPTIRKDLVSLVARARDLGYERIKIQSNGLMYAYPDFVDRLLRAGANQFNVSVMGRDRAMYRSIMGQERHFDLVVEGIGQLVRRDAPIVADVIMKRDTWERLPDTIGCFADLGVEHFVLWLVSLTDRNADHPESLVPVSTMRPGIYGAFELARRRGIEVLSRHIPRCMLPEYPGHLWDVRQDDVLVVTPGSTFWLKDSRITANTFVETCDGCAARGTCLGVRRDYLDRYGDGEVEPLAAQ